MTPTVPVDPTKLVVSINGEETCVACGAVKIDGTLHHNAGCPVIALPTTLEWEEPFAYGGPYIEGMPKVTMRISVENAAAAQRLLGGDYPDSKKAVADFMFARQARYVR